MGSYSSGLSHRLRGNERLRTEQAAMERLRCAAITRGGEVLERGFKSHYELRLALTGNGDKREPGDIEGFMTTSDRFLTRREAVSVGIACGQLDQSWRGAGRELLSSDISW